MGEHSKDLRSRIQERVPMTSPVYLAGAVLAVVDKCAALRLEGGSPLQVAANYAAADEFEQTLARALGLTA